MVCRDVLLDRFYYTGVLHHKPLLDQNNITLLLGSVKSIGCCHFHHMLMLFIAPPDDDAEPHRPDISQVEG